MAQRPGGEALFQLVEHIACHRMQIGQRLRSDLDPNQFHQLCLGMDHAFDMMGDGGGIGGEKPCIEPPHPARWGDRAGNQEQAGGVGQQPGIGKRFPRAFEGGSNAIALAAETEPGFLAGLADRRDRQRACARRRDLRTALEQIGFELFRDRRGDGNAVVGCIDASFRPM